MVVSKVRQATLDCVGSGLSFLYYILLANYSFTVSGLGEICYNMFYDIFGPRSGDAGI